MVEHSADRAAVLKLLNDALATELMGVLRYRRHHFVAQSIRSHDVAREFLEHSNAEQVHADQIAERIVQLGGSLDFAQDGLTNRSDAAYVPRNILTGMINENLAAGRIAIDNYRGVIQYLGNGDDATRRMFEGMLVTQEQCADKLSDLLKDFPGAVRHE